ncbi:MAG: hypothetical protein SF069_05680 [Phycisphaerae bacterium]|nr:hypothetical protein [Phycisphaerae bacterium]
MTRALRRVKLLFCGAIFAPSAVVLADSVKLLDRPVFENVAVEGFRDGKLHFRGVSGQLLKKPLAQVEWFTADNVPELTEAERAIAGGRAADAIPLLVSAVKEDSEPWLKDWVQLRLLRAFDAAGRFDEAVAQYVELLRSGAADERVAPPRVAGPPESAMNAAARRILKGALDDPKIGAAQMTARGFLLEIALLDDASDQITEIRGDATAAESKRRQKPRYGLLPEQSEARPKSRFGLPPNSFLLSYAARVLEPLPSAEEKRPPTPTEEDLARALRVLSNARSHLADADGELATLLIGRLRGATGDSEGAMQAFTELLAREETNGAIAAEAGYRAAGAYESAGQIEAAIRAYRDAAGRSGCPEEISRRARAALRRLNAPLIAPAAEPAKRANTDSESNRP